MTTLDEMEREHESIDPLLNAVTAELARLSSTADEDARAEERDAIAILQRYVPGEEWAALEAKKFRGGMTFAQVRVLVPWAYKGLSREATAHVDEAEGLPFRVIHRLNRAKFARADATAFGV